MVFSNDLGDLCFGASPVVGTAGRKFESLQRGRDDRIPNLLTMSGTAGWPT